MSEEVSNNPIETFDTININNEENTEVIAAEITDNLSRSNSTERRVSLTSLEDVLTAECGEDNISITVSEPQKVGDGMNSYLAYKVTTKTKIPKFKSFEFSTLRRFSDFLGIHALLVDKYLRLGQIIPPAPSKNIIGSTKVKMSPQQTESGNNLNLEWVEVRRAALQRFLNRVAQHPVLRVDLDFINFLESDQELPRSINTAVLSGAGVMRLFNKVGETVNKITYKMDENDLWFDKKIADVENLDLLLQKLHATLKDLVSSRKELAASTELVAKSAAMLSTCEEHTDLSRALSSLADVEEKIEILRSAQANSDFFIFSEIIKDYLGLFGAIKSAFHERVKVFQNWQYAQMQLTKRRENKTKMDSAGRNDKKEQMQEEVHEWEAKVQRCQKEFDDISITIKNEMERFDVIRTKEIKTSVLKYVEDQMAHQHQLIGYWEAFAPSAREIM
ncbi:sorting nexin-2 [Eupeodes corollae]|uniref:sorting nexin-2 n=1 Tax=Eupeodes corollae TaxID=290404 RepID=UPI002490A942|nr:sorting nexin-2 [Eupeodes corollae]